MAKQEQKRRTRDDFPELTEAKRKLAGLDRYVSEKTRLVRELEAKVADEKAAAESIDALALEMLDGKKIDCGLIDKFAADLRLARRELLVATRAHERQAEIVRETEAKVTLELRREYEPVRRQIVSDMIAAGQSYADRHEELKRQMVDISEIIGMETPMPDRQQFCTSFNEWGVKMDGMGLAKLKPNNAKQTYVRLCTSIVMDGLNGPRGEAREGEVVEIDRETAERLVSSGQALPVPDINKLQLAGVR